MKKPIQITLTEDLVDRLRQEYKGSTSPLIEGLLLDYFETLDGKTKPTEDKVAEVLEKKKQADEQYKNLVLEKERELAEAKEEQERMEKKKQDKIRSTTDSIYDFFNVTKAEAEGWAKTYLEAKEKEPNIDYWEFLKDNGLKEKRDEDVLEDVFGGDDEIEKAV